MNNELEKSDPNCYGQDNQKYSRDSHEVFFAYSDDQGLTWKNLDNTKSVSSVICTTGRGYNAEGDCKKNLEAGILHFDEAYRITDTRQGEKRHMWIDPDGTIYVTFYKSKWCDSGFCPDPDTKISTNPGALMLLTFELGDSTGDIVETTLARTNINLLLQFARMAMIYTFGRMK